jgi:hypothetical protein
MPAKRNKYSHRDELTMDKALNRKGMMRNQYIERIENENLLLRTLLTEAKRFVPADLRDQIETYFSKPPEPPTGTQ